MSARVIEADRLFDLNRILLHEPGYRATQARQALKDIAIHHPDLTVAAVASRLSRPGRIAEPNSGDAA